jgi:hypothetical protein
LLLHYRLGISSGAARYIHDNQWRSDFRGVTAHEDWFLHNERGQRHHHPTNDWDIHDIQHPAFREYWVASVIADMRATGAQGVFADSFEAGVSGYGITPPDRRFDRTAPADPAAWPGGVTWLQQKLAFVDFIVDRLHAAREQFLFVPNIGGLTTTWWWPGYANVDGAMLENFALKTTADDWVLSMNRALELTRAGKLVIVQSYPDSVQERLFLVASYLLIKGQRTFINAGGSDVLYFPEYELPLGPAPAALPTSVAAYAWEGLYRRDFRDASILVNPGPASVRIPMPEAFQLATPSGGGRVTDAQVDPRGRYTGGTLTFTDPAELLLPPQSAAFLIQRRR